MGVQRLFPRFHARSEHRPIGTRSEDAIAIRWLGTAGHVLSYRGTTLLLDPFVSRPGPRALLAPLVSDTSLFSKWLPEKIDAVLCGHSHYDHLLDAPSIARRYGAKLAGSRSTAAFARASGVASADILEVPPAGASFTVGQATIEFVPSLHGRIFFGRVPFPGDAPAAPRLPLHAWRYRMGGAFGIRIRMGERTIYHNGSADLIDVALGDRGADVALIGLAGRRATRDYLGRLSRALSPKVVIPTHHDAFFGPLDEGERLLPGIDMPGFYSEIRTVSPAARIVTPLYDDEVLVPATGEPRDVAVAPWRRGT